ncbi:MAG: oligosaccharide flippase family protein [Nanoarchaeota archaeon]
MYLKRKIKNIKANIYSNRSVGEFLKHGFNYLGGDFFDRGLSFLAIPIFTRLLTKEEYGLVAIFLTINQIFSNILGLGIRGAVTRYYYEYKGDFYQFLSSNVLFIIFFNCVTLIVIYFTSSSLAGFFNVSERILFIGVISAFFQVIFFIYRDYLVADKQSLKYAFVNVLKTLVILALGIVWVYQLNEDRHLGRISAQMLVLVIVGVYSLLVISKKSKLYLHKHHIKYAISFGLPILLHLMAGFILNRFDQIIINQLKGAEETGLYSFAYNIGTIMQIIVIGLQKSFRPQFFENRVKNNYNVIQNITGKFTKFILTSAILLIVFSKEITKIIGDKSFWEAYNIIPLIILGYIFFYFYTIYSIYSQYHKKTMSLAIYTIIAGVINIGLNYLIIPQYGNLGAAITTLISFLILFLLHFFHVKYVLKEKNIYKINIYVFIQFILIVFIALIIVNKNLDDLSYTTELIIKFVYLFCIISFIFWNKIKTIFLQYFTNK